MKEQEMHLLMSRGVPIAAAERWERLSEESARFTAEEQKHLTITSVTNLDED